MEDAEQKKNYKYCIVPQCESTSVKTPEKIFISLPRNAERNKQWQKAMKRKKTLSVKSTYFVCEDHFDLEADMENYRYFKLMDNVPIKMRLDVVPHIFDCQKTRTATHGTQSRKVSLKRRQQAVHQQNRTESTRNRDHLGAKAANEGYDKEIQVNIDGKPSTLTKQTQCDLYRSKRLSQEDKLVFLVPSSSSSSATGVTSTSGSFGISSDTSCGDGLKLMWNQRGNSLRKSVDRMDRKESFCMLCRNNVIYYEVLDDATRNIVHVLLPQLNLPGTNEQVMCSDCSTKLSAAFEFKSMCLCTDNAIIPHLEREKALQVDLREVYLKENEEKQPFHIPEEQKICRLCMKLVKDEGDVEIGRLEKFLPEMNFGLVKDPVVCESCAYSVEAHGDFLKNCLDVERKADDPDLFGRSEVPLLNSRFKTEDFALATYIKMEIEQDEYDEVPVRPEYVGVKSEPIEQSSDILPFDLDEELKNVERVTGNRIVKLEGDRDGLKREIDPLDVETLDGGQLYRPATRKDLSGREIDPVPSGYASPKAAYKCDLCFFETQWKATLDAHKLRHSGWKGKIYGCDHCDYETKNKSYLTEHSLTHRDPARAEIHACAECDFTTNRKCSLRKHQFVHRLPSGTAGHRCDECDHQARCKSDLAAHKLKHRSPSEVPVYRCDECDFQTKYRRSLGYHKLRHRKPSEAKTFECDECGHRTKRKRSLEMHRAIHGTAASVPTFKCGDCGYESKDRSNFQRHRVKHGGSRPERTYGCEQCDHVTNNKSNLSKHRLKHQDASQARMYECPDCDYKSKYSTSLNHHRLKHKDPSEVPKYRCEGCEYETVNKTHLATHQLRHKSSEETRMYRCDRCEYETKHKSNLPKHQLRHMASSEVPSYGCEECGYESKYKTSLTQHRLKHRGPGEVRMFRCGECDYEAKFKHVLTRHLLTHRDGAGGST